MTTKLLQAALAEAAADTFTIGYAEFCESPLFCGLTLTPVVKAIVLASEGRPITLPDAEKYFGCPASALPRVPRLTVAVRAGGGGGKSSRLLATKALHAAWTVPLPHIARGEFAASAIIAKTMPLARQTLDFCKGYIDGSPVLSGCRIKDDRTDDIKLLRPDGKRIRVQIIPASVRGAGARSRRYVFVGLDEAEFFWTGTDYAVNDEDIFRAVRQRILPGAQVWVVSTPWLAHLGLLERLIDTQLGKHEMALCVANVGTRAMNPFWDPTGEIERDMRATDPDGARAEIDGIPLPGTAGAFFAADVLDACIDRGDKGETPRKPAPGDRVNGGADMGLLHDYAALCIVHHVGDAIVVADLQELRPTPEAPLKPSEVARAWADKMQAHGGLRYLVADQHYREAVREVFTKADLSIKDAPVNVSEAYIRARALMRERRVKIPDHPRLLTQLRAIQSRANVGGSITIIKPRGLGGHCDLADAFALALWDAGGVEVEKPRPAAERSWKKHWDLSDETNLDPGERECLEQVEQGIKSEWDTMLEEESYGVIRR